MPTRKKMLTQNQLKSIFAEHNFAPLKRLGENYLIDGNIKDKIISEVAPSREDVILEIGPGLGALTIDLAESCAAVTAVEMDRKAAAILKDMTALKFPNLNIVNGDILEFDLKSIAREKVKIVGNLPYYITTPILEYLLDNKSLISKAVVMVQNEVASRLTAKAGEEYYGSLSCYIQYHAKVERVYMVKRGSFFPTPDVDSAIVRIEMLDSPSVKVRDEALIFKIIRGSFNQRRKSIINSLSREAVLDITKEELAAILNAASIDPTDRPERLSLSDFAKIANSISSK